MTRAGFAPSVDLMFTIKDDGDYGTDVIHVPDAQDTVVQQITCLLDCDATYRS
jgi:hypothetical protein